MNIKHFGCHTFRHSFATHLLVSGYDMRTIQELPGRRNVTSPMIFIRCSQSRPFRGVKPDGQLVDVFLCGPAYSPGILRDKDDSCVFTSTCMQPSPAFAGA